MRLHNKVLACLVASCVSVNIFAASSFVVKAIRVEGLQSIPESTVINYLPIKVGDTISPENSATILQSLYNTGLFENVNLSQEGNTLVIKVSERTGIGTIIITGNKKIKTADINTMLKGAGITSGSLANQEKLNVFKESLLQQYYNMGRYNAQIDISTRSVSSSRTDLQIRINEGNVAKVHAITITGNEAFSERQLVKQFVLTTPHIWSFINHDDEYSKPKLDASLQNLEAFYLNRGYLKFKILSSEANLTPDKSGVIITVNVSEGPKYTFSGYNLTGNLILPREQLTPLITIHPGDVFSRQAVIDSDTALGTALGDKGYAFAQVQPMPTINEQDRTVFINFFINPGQRVYVRRITFSGNTETSDTVMRHTITQTEGSLVEVSKVKESVRQLNLLGFFKDVEVKTTPVPGTSNQVDIDFAVKETPAGQASVNLGYGTLGFEVGAGINQPNFLGTGRTVGLNFSRSQYMTSYSFNYFNPYYTINNIGRGFSLYYQVANPKNLNLANYAFNTYGFSYYYSIPLSLDDHLQAGFTLAHIQLKVNPNAVPFLISNYIATYGSNFNQLVLNAGWTHVGLDKTIYPTQGFEQGLGANFSVPISSNKLEYYTTNYNAAWYLPLNHTHSFIFVASGGAGYGNGYGSQNGLPFFVNYYAGGLSTGQVRGYETNDLGPQVLNPSTNTLEFIGGNFLAYGSTAMIFPNYISDSIRTSLFIDAGNVYQTNDFLKSKKIQALGPGPIRYTGGLGVEWQSPIGPLSFSYALPFNKQKGDQLEPFQFTMGTSF